MTKETVVSDPCRDSVRVEKVLWPCVPELVTGEEPVVSTSSGRVTAGRAELASVPELVAVEDMLSNSPGGKVGVFLETEELVFAEWTREAVVSGSGEETVTVGTMELASAAGWVPHEAAVSG